MNIRSGQVYRHFKGGFYRVLNLAQMEDSQERMVVYQNIQDSRIWIRPVIAFLEEVARDNYSGPRFVLVNCYEDCVYFVEGAPGGSCHSNCTDICAECRRLDPVCSFALERAAPKPNPSV